jgi:glutamate synthase (NADPH) large chain
VLVLGPIGVNFGSGMTGGLAYVLRAEAEGLLNRDFVALHDTSVEEEAWLRRMLENHLELTGSPRAGRLLSRETLPFVRVQPIHLQGTIENTWRPVLARLPQSETLLVSTAPEISQAAMHA